MALGVTPGRPQRPSQQFLLFRFAYHLRQWQIEGTGISSHLKALSDKQSLPLRIVCQPAGLPDKVTARPLTPLHTLTPA